MIYLHEFPIEWIVVTKIKINKLCLISIIEFNKFLNSNGKKFYEKLKKKRIWVRNEMCFDVTVNWLVLRDTFRSIK